MITIGFDLDLTLADTRRAIAATFEVLAAETGAEIDLDQVITRIGVPLETELTHWFPEERIPVAADRYGELYPEIAIPKTTLMPGAAQIIQAVRDRGDRVIVVTGKSEDNAVETVRRLGLDVASVIGSLFGAAKGAALRAHDALIYVGDHPGDVDAARAAGAFSVGVATGGHDARSLAAHGADLAVKDLPTLIECLSEVIEKARSQVHGPATRH